MMSLPPILSPIQSQGWVVFHNTQTLSLHVGRVDPRAVSFVSFHNPSTGLKFSIQYCFIFLFFRKKFVSGGPYHRRHLRLSTDEVSPNLWFGEVIWVFDPGINRQILLIEGSGIHDNILWSWILSDDGDVHIIPQLDYSGFMEEQIMVTNRQRWIRRYKRHVSEPFQAIYQCVRLFKVMRKAFGNFIYKMLAFYEYMKRGLNRCHLLPIRLSFGKQGYFHFFIEIVFNFLYFIQWLYFNGSCIMYDVTLL
ncbi:unnamed protein product [Arabidopsis lyrata]|nr:unnamed protein product [Arabidopsis lyrata]